MARLHTCVCFQYRQFYIAELPLLNCRWEWACYHTTVWRFYTARPGTVCQKQFQVLSGWVTRFCGLDSETCKERMVRYIFLTAHLLSFFPRYVVVDYLEIPLHILNFSIVDLELIICYVFEFVYRWIPENLRASTVNVPWSGPKQPVHFSLNDCTIHCYVLLYLYTTFKVNCEECRISPDFSLEPFTWFSYI